MTGLHKELFKQAEYYILMEEVIELHSSGKTFEEIQSELEISNGLLYELIALNMTINKLRKSRKGEIQHDTKSISRKSSTHN